MPASWTRLRSARCSMSTAAAKPTMAASFMRSRCSVAGGMIRGANPNGRNLQNGKRGQRLSEAAVSRAARPPVSECLKSQRPLVWLLTGSRVGDNNQLLALGRALGFPFEVKRLDFNRARHLRFLRRGLSIVAPQSRALIGPPWPDLVVG